ncbi:MAG: nucleotidyl transferase AbiEii/AbiGii toxin family protein [Deltaproteobacteria bacterium]|nr:nucleotidyl transferase AbiEii/AbiGii toxin family protein [Deltaproteobacteria bacterium]
MPRRPRPALIAALTRARQDLEDAHARFALVGGMAVSARTEPRFTRDIDFVVAVDGDVAAERLIGELGYRVLAVAEHRSLGRLATVRLASPLLTSAPPIVDLLFCSSGIEPETVAAADTIDIVSGVSIPVAKMADLVAMKVLSEKPTRPKDSADILAMLRGMSRDEIDRVPVLLEKIESRGAGRGKDLQAVWQRYRAIAAGHHRESE